MRGVGSARNRGVVKDNLNQTKPEIVILQETKEVDREFVEIWATFLNG